MPLYDAVELLCQAMGAQGRDEADKIISQAKERAASLLAAEEDRYQEELRRTKGEVEAKANLEARNRIDRAELESKRRVAQTKENILEEIFTLGMERLKEFRQSPQYQPWLQENLMKVLTTLEGEGFRVAAHPQEAGWLTPDLLAAVSRDKGWHLEFQGDEDLSPGGFMVIREDGRVRYDQTFQGIIDRQREILRSQVARRLWGA